MPNTRFVAAQLRVVEGRALAWVGPVGPRCPSPPVRLAVVASSTSPIRRVGFLVDGRRIGDDRRGVAGLYTRAWRARGAVRGRHLLRAVVFDARGRTASARRRVRLCP